MNFNDGCDQKPHDHEGRYCYSDEGLRPISSIVYQQFGLSCKLLIWVPGIHIESYECK